MRVLHLAAGNRWTGAAAPAFAEVEALRAAGVEAHYAYVGGYRLEAKIGHHPFAHAVIEKAQNPMSFARSVRAIRELVRTHGIDILHAHLTYDHWLARFAATDGVRVARTFHARRVLRTDTFTQHLLGRTAFTFVINDAFRTAPALRGREAIFTPPPLDLRQFSPGTSTVRSLYGISDSAKLVTVIGKLSEGRGFEAALESFAELHRRMPEARMMIIGHGEHRAALEDHARAHGIIGHVHWAGYHEDDLTEHYRASDLLFFTARGSDEGHRAVLEAMGCGVPVVSYPIEGVDVLTGPSMVAPAASPDALATVAQSVLSGDLAALSRSAAEKALAFGYEPAAQRLIAAYSNPALRA
jgi:glycosyltransferase involved in cell wall biosynthesis